jgi:hypothetical protein
MSYECILDRRGEGRQRIWKSEGGRRKAESGRQEAVGKKLRRSEDQKWNGGY